MIKRRRLVTKSWAHEEIGYARVFTLVMVLQKYGGVSATFVRVTTWNKNKNTNWFREIQGRKFGQTDLRKTTLKKKYITLSIIHVAIIFVSVPVYERIIIILRSQVSKSDIRFSLFSFHVITRWSVIDDRRCWVSLDSFEEIYFVMYTGTMLPSGFIFVIFDRHECSFKIECSIIRQHNNKVPSVAD